MLKIKRSELKQLAQDKLGDDSIKSQNKVLVMISTSLAARTSYTVVGDEKEIDYKKMIDLHDKIIEKRHDSPLEHCAKAMTHDEYYSFQKGFINMDELEVIVENSPTNGWCKNYRGFIQYRHLIETSGLYK